MKEQIQEHLKSFDSELKQIELVLNKLVTKQNSDVFNKLCVKCEELFEDFCSKVQVGVAVNSGMKEECIAFLKGLLNVCVQLQNYKAYLIEVIPQNIEKFQKAEETPQVSEVTPVELEETNNVVSFEKPQTLKLTNQENRNAA